MLLNAGLDAELTPKLRLITQRQLLRFQHTETLQRCCSRTTIDKAIGLDYGVRRAVSAVRSTTTCVITGGVSVVQPGSGFKQILTTRMLYSPFVVLTLTY